MDWMEILKDSPALIAMIVVVVIFTKQFNLLSQVVSDNTSALNNLKDVVGRLLERDRTITSLMNRINNERN